MESKHHSHNLMDYHLHTSVTIDGRMSESEACERCLSLGIFELAFTNHIMLTQPDYTISPRAFIDHWRRVSECQKRFPQLKIQLGIEMDYYLDREDDINTKLKYYEGLIGRKFDLVLGSVHDVDGSFFSNKHQAPAFFKDRDLISLYRDYFQIATRAAQSGLFDIMAHPDLIKKYTHELTPPLPFEAYRDFVEPFIDAMLRTGVGIEVNVKGLKHSVNEAYPTIDFLRLYLDQVRLFGVKPIVTTGSDAHKVEEVGLHIAQTADSLHQLNITSLTRFNQRQKSDFVI